MSFDATQPERQPNPAPQLPDFVMDMFSMKGKVSIIVGAGSGIGLAAAEALAEAGSDVCLWYNSNPKAIEHAKRLSEKFHIRAEAYKVSGMWYIRREH